jgi:hypothetical protein
MLGVGVRTQTVVDWVIEWVRVCVCGGGDCEYESVRVIGCVRGVSLACMRVRLSASEYVCAFE